MRKTAKLERGSILARPGTISEPPVLPREIDGLPVFQSGELVTAEMLNRIVERLRAVEARLAALSG